MINIRKKFNMIYKNLKFLGRVDLESWLNDEYYDSVMTYVGYDLLNKVDNAFDIMSPEKTINLLKKHNISFSRFGDGEIRLMEGESIEFQNSTPLLASRMREILTSEEDGFYIGINYAYFRDSSNLNKPIRIYVRNIGNRLRTFLISNCSSDRTYIDAGITQLFQLYKEYDFEFFFNNVVSLFEDKKITVICGKGIFDNIEYSIFEKALNVEYITGPSHNAFDSYNKILEDAKKVSKDNLICIILGPTAKVLAYDLYRLGYTAWDIGHLVKDYDVYKKGVERTNENILNFFAAD